MDRHGRCIVNGKPFFPLGMYWNPNERNMAAFTNGPFNCVVHYEMMTPRRLDFCRAHGLMSKPRGGEFLPDGLTIYIPIRAEALCKTALYASQHGFHHFCTTCGPG